MFSTFACPGTLAVGSTCTNTYEDRVDGIYMECCDGKYIDYKTQFCDDDDKVQVIPATCTSQDTCPRKMRAGAEMETRSMVCCNGKCYDSDYNSCEDGKTLVKRGLEGEACDRDNRCRGGDNEGNLEC